MTSRALPLVLAAVAVAGGLAFLLLGGDGPPERSTGPLVSARDPRPVPKQEDPAPQRATLREELLGNSGPWTILPTGSKGELLADAKVTARRGDEVLTGTGKTVFAGLEPGVWSLTVEAEGLPDYREDWTLPGANQSLRSIAQLTNEIRLSGLVLDERGEPVKGVSVWLLGEGKAHPKDGKEAAAGGQQQSPTSVSGIDGRFRLSAAAPGKFRLSIGRAGETARYEGQPFELAPGRERIARVVVPARARLYVDVPSDDFVGKNVVSVLAERDMRPVGADPDTKLEEGGDAPFTRTGAREVSKDELEAARKKRVALGEAGDDGGDLAKAGGDLAALTAEQQARMREAEERAQRERQRRARLIEEGWAAVRSARFDSGATAVVEDLPEEKQLRFVLYRGLEGLLVSDTLVAPRGAIVTLRLTPPPPLPAGTELPDFPRTSGSRLEVQRLGDDALPVGITFEN